MAAAAGPPKIGGLARVGTGLVAGVCGGRKQAVAGGWTARSGGCAGARTLGRSADRARPAGGSGVLSTQSRLRSAVRARKSTRPNQARPGLRRSDGGAVQWNPPLLLSAE